MWALVAGFVKAYNLPLDYVLYDMSYANMVMYSAVLPSYDSKKDRGSETGKQDIIKADDPRNSEKVLALLQNAE